VTVEQVTASRVSFDLTIDSTVDAFTDAESAALVAAIQGSLQCYTPACYVELELRSGSLVATVLLTSPDATSDSDAVAALYTASQELTSKDSPTLSANLGVTVLLASTAAVQYDVVALIAVAPPPPFPPPLAPPSPPPPLNPPPPPRGPPSGSALSVIIWVGIGAGSVALLVFSLVGFRSWCRKHSDAKARGPRDSSTVKDSTRGGVRRLSRRLSDAALEAIGMRTQSKEPARAVRVGPLTAQMNKALGGGGLTSAALPPQPEIQVVRGIAVAVIEDREWGPQKLRSDVSAGDVQIAHAPIVHAPMAHVPLSYQRLSFDSLDEDLKPDRRVRCNASPDACMHAAPVKLAEQTADTPRKPRRELPQRGHHPNRGSGSMAPEKRAESRRTSSKHRGRGAQERSPSTRQEHRSRGHHNHSSHSHDDSHCQSGHGRGHHSRQQQHSGQRRPHGAVT